MQVVRTGDEFGLLLKVQITLTKEQIAKAITDNGWKGEDLNRKEIYARCRDYAERLLQEQFFITPEEKNSPEFQESLRIVAFYFPELGSLADFL